MRFTFMKTFCFIVMLLLSATFSWADGAVTFEKVEKAFERKVEASPDLSIRLSPTAKKEQRATTVEYRAYQRKGELDELFVIAHTTISIFGREGAERLAAEISR